VPDKALTVQEVGKRSHERPNSPQDPPGPSAAGLTRALFAIP
jgi:hypothetical protein